MYIVQYGIYSDLYVFICICTYIKIRTNMFYMCNGVRIMKVLQYVQNYTYKCTYKYTSTKIPTAIRIERVRLRNQKVITCMYVHAKLLMYPAYNQYTAGCCCCVTDGRTAASSAAISSRHHVQEMLPTGFLRNCPITLRKALTFRFRHGRLYLYLSQTQNCQGLRISFEYPLKMGAEGMFCSS